MSLLSSGLARIGISKETQRGITSVAARVIPGGGLIKGAADAVATALNGKAKTVIQNATDTAVNRIQSSAPVPTQTPAASDMTPLLIGVGVVAAVLFAGNHGGGGGS